MRIDPGQDIAGIPTVQIRDMFRRIGGGGIVDVEYLQDRLRLSPGQAAVVLNELISADLLAKDERFPAEAHYQLTLKGSALALATAAKPLRRKTAEKLLAGLLTRIAAVRNDPEYLLRVERAVLFGSMTTEAERLNDVDVAIEYTRKEPDADRYIELAKASAQAAADAGRHFGTYADWIGWPRRKLLLFLKAGSTGLSLHPLDDWVLSQPGARVIYSHDDAPGQQLMFDR